MVPTEFPNADSHTNVELQGNLLQEHAHKFAQLPEDQKLSKLCCDAGLKIDERGHFFITLGEEEGLDEMKNSCREYTFPRSEETSQVGGWIRANTEIGPVLDVKVCSHQGRYGVEIMIESLFRYRTVSWVRIVSGIQKYVTETSQTISIESVEHGVTAKFVTKSKPQPRPTATLSPISIPMRERKWIDIKPGILNQGCVEMSKFMIRLLRHDDSIPREDDEAVRFDDLIGKMKANIEVISQWTVEVWTNFLAKGGGPKKKIQYCLNTNSSEHFLYLREIQGHSGGTLVDLTLQDNVLLPDGFAEHINHIGNVCELYSIIKSG